MPFVDPYGLFPETSGPLKLSAILTGLGLSALLALDPADDVSYDGSSQTFVDVSGNGNDFYRGVTSAVQATDPTFVGVAGSVDEDTYFSFDGGDFFREVSSAMSFAESWHSENAEWTFVAMVYTPAPGLAGASLFNWGEKSGGYVLVSTSRNLQLVRQNAAGTIQFVSTTMTVNASEWAMLAVRCNEPGGGARFNVNLTSEDKVWTSSYNATAAGPVVIGARYASAVPTSYLPNGARLGPVAAFGSVLSDEAIASLYAEFKKRYTSLP